MAEVSNQTMMAGSAMQEPAPYKVYGTNEPYNGLTVEVGGFLYSTVGGALEGDSMQLTANIQPAQPQPIPPNGNGNNVVPPPIGTGMTPPNIVGGSGNTGGGNNQIGGSPSNQNQPSPQGGGMGGGGSY